MEFTNLLKITHLNQSFLTNHMTIQDTSKSEQSKHTCDLHTYQQNTKVKQCENKNIPIIESNHDNNEWM